MAMALGMSPLAALSFSTSAVVAVAQTISEKVVETNPLLRAIAWTHLLRSLYRRNYIQFILLAITIPKFRLGRGRTDAEPLSVLSHLFRLLAFHRVDLKLPPRINLSTIVESQLRWGPWQRHKFESTAIQRHGANGAVSAMLPMNRMHWSKPATLIAFLSDPEDVEQVLSDKAAFPTRGHTGFNDLVGEGLLGMVTGPKWASHRRLVSKFLSDNHLRAFGKVVEEETTVLLDLWTKAQGRPVNAQYDLSMCTLDVIMRTAFGVPDEYRSQGIPQADNDIAHGLDEALKAIVIRTAFFIYGWLPTKLNRETQKAVEDHNDLAERLFALGKAKFERDPDGPVTMLSEMLRARKNNEADTEGLTDQEIMDELKTIRGAGHETTSNTLSWCMLLLAQHPEELAKLRAESEQMVGGRVATYDEAKQLRLHRACFYEALRMFPTVSSFPRECHQDVVLRKSGFDIPVGSLVFVSQLAMNTNPALWGDDADQFRPERFLNAGALKMSEPLGIPNGGPAYGFTPFGAGPRTCIGQRMAELEAIQILASLTKNMQWRLADPKAEVEPVCDITLGPKKGLNLIIEPRA